jgi:hypothetical protein
MKLVRLFTMMIATLCLAGSLAFAAATDAEIAAAKSKGMVWVNTDSKVYHKDGRYYGKTKQGQFMTEGDAQKYGARAAEREIGEKGSKAAPTSAAAPAKPAAPAPASSATSSTPAASTDDKTPAKRKRKKKTDDSTTPAATSK